MDSIGRGEYNQVDETVDGYNSQGRAIFPAIGLRPDFKPKLREDGTLNCLGAMEVNWWRIKSQRWQLVLLKIIDNYNAGGEHGHGDPTGESLGGVADDRWGRRPQLGQCQVIPMIELVVGCF